MATLFYTQPKPQPIQKLAPSPLFFPSCFVATGCLMSLQGSVWLFNPEKTSAQTRRLKACPQALESKWTPNCAKKNTPQLLHSHLHHVCCCPQCTNVVGKFRDWQGWKVVLSRLAGFVELLHVLTVLNLLTGNDTILSDNSFHFFLLFERKECTICFHPISILFHLAALM